MKKIKLFFLLGFVFILILTNFLFVGNLPKNTVRQTFSSGSKKITEDAQLDQAMNKIRSYLIWEKNYWEKKLSSLDTVRGISLSFDFKNDDGEPGVWGGYKNATWNNTPLLKLSNLDKISGSQLPSNAKKSLLGLITKNALQAYEQTVLWNNVSNPLWSNEVYEKTDKLLDKIRPNLLRFKEENLEKVKINEKSYSVEYLIKTENLNVVKSSKLSRIATYELINLLFVDFSKGQTPITYITATETEETTQNNQSSKKSKEKESNNNLVIGLSVAGGTLVLSALSGFLYWFFKVKK